MTDVEFVQRLEHELKADDRWPEIQAVVNSQEDDSLATNELLVYPVPRGRRRKSIDVLRVVVEHLSMPRDG